MTASGLPVEVLLAPGAEADIRAFRRLGLDLPPEAHVFADAGYLDRHEEALLQDAGLHLVAQRRRNSKQPLAPWVAYFARRKRKYIETVFRSRPSSARLRRPSGAPFMRSRPEASS